MRWYCKYYTFTQHIFFHPNSGIFHDSFFSPSCSLAPGSSKCVLLPWQLLRSPRFKGVRRGNEGCTTARLDLSDLSLRQKTKISTYFFKWWKIPKHSTETPTFLGVGWIFLWFFLEGILQKKSVCQVDCSPSLAWCILCRNRRPVAWECMPLWIFKVWVSGKPKGLNVCQNMVNTGTKVHQNRI